MPLAEAPAPTAAGPKVYPEASTPPIVSERVAVIDRTLGSIAAELPNNARDAACNMPAGELVAEHYGNAINERGLATDPDILILDEPTAGIDIGSITANAAVMQDGRLLGSRVIFTGYNAEAAGRRVFEELLGELKELVENLRISVVRATLVNLRAPTPALLLGSGKAKYFRRVAAQYGTDFLTSPAGQYNYIQGGNASLSPEKSNSYTFGMVFDQPFKGFTATIDYWNITVEDTIGTVPSPTALDQCVQTGSPEYCDLITRDSQGTLWLLPQAQIVATNVIIGETKTSGWDIGVNYALRIEVYDLRSPNLMSSSSMRIEARYATELARQLDVDELAAIDDLPAIEKNAWQKVNEKVSKIGLAVSGISPRAGPSGEIMTIRSSGIRISSANRSR